MYAAFKRLITAMGQSATVAGHDAIGDRHFDWGMSDPSSRSAGRRTRTIDPEYPVSKTGSSCVASRSQRLLTEAGAVICYPERATVNGPVLVPGPTGAVSDTPEESLAP